MDDVLRRRFTALERLTRLAARYAPEAAPESDALQEAQALADRAHARLSTGDARFTVVALAGPTGVGKSSLFNALAGMPLSPAGFVRPTTGQPYACVWEAPDAPGPGAGAMLDWLGVDEDRRFMRESALDADDEAGLRGLVLLDLPDIDSIAGGNRIEADRLVGMVDIVIWVLDPQKYADASVHDAYLRELGALRDVTMVVLNQVDLLTAAEADECRADLVRLVEADGLSGVPVLATSTVTGHGIGELRDLLEKSVFTGSAAVARLESELAEVVTRLSPLAPHPGPDEHWLSHEAVPELARGLAVASSVDALAVEAGLATRAGAKLVRWPWKRRAPLPVTPAADAGEVTQTIRRLADQASERLPQPWAERLRAEAIAEARSLPEELAAALAAVRAQSMVSPLWTVMQWVWWLSVAAFLSAAVPALSPVDPRPWVFAGIIGATLTLALPVAAAPVAAWSARRRRRLVARRLRLAVLTVARELVAPVRQVLRDYAEAYALAQVAGDRGGWRAESPGRRPGEE